MDVSRKVMEDFLWPYHIRYLLRAEEEYPVMKGDFHIEKSVYTPVQSNHLNIIDLQICFNQLIYTSFGQALLEKNPPFNISYGAFKEKQIQSLIYKIDTLVFRRPVKNDFTMRIRFISHKKFKETYFFSTHFDIQDRVYGDISCAIPL